MALQAFFAKSRHSKRRSAGIVKERNFLGAHIWSGKKLLTWAPGVKPENLAHINQSKAADGFYLVEPKYFGKFRSADLFSGYPRGKYIILMYTSIPTNRQYAEEKLTLWLDDEGKWQVVAYTIADNI